MLLRLLKHKGGDRTGCIFTQRGSLGEPPHTFKGVKMCIDVDETPPLFAFRDKFSELCHIVAMRAGALVLVEGPIGVL